MDIIFIGCRWLHCKDINIYIYIIVRTPESSTESMPGSLIHIDPVQESGCSTLLVGGDWNMNVMTFHSVGNVIIPTDSNIFQRVETNHQPAHPLRGYILIFITTSIFAMTCLPFQQKVEGPKTSLARRIAKSCPALTCTIAVLRILDVAGREENMCRCFSGCFQTGEF